MKRLIHKGFLGCFKVFQVLSDFFKFFSVFQVLSIFFSDTSGPHFSLCRFQKHYPKRVYLSQKSFSLPPALVVFPFLLLSYAKIAYFVFEASKCSFSPFGDLVTSVNLTEIINPAKPTNPARWKPWGEKALKEESLGNQKELHKKNPKNAFDCEMRREQLKTSQWSKEELSAALRRSWICPAQS